jgi:hypothetical protein
MSLATDLAEDAETFVLHTVEMAHRPLMITEIPLRAGYTVVSPREWAKLWLVVRTLLASGRLEVEETGEGRFVYRLPAVPVV